ncbi:hypothetical protein [Gaopeijia maritima]|uniref:hypothetical protein n=1 Tax=Gaopeijia maritima TaxID=3119007 RepID=UPI0032933022
MPRSEDGSYPWPEVENAYRALKSTAETKRASGFGDLSYEEARAQKVAAQARKEALQVLQLEAQLVAIEDVAEMLSRPLQKVDAVLKLAPARYAPRLARSTGLTLHEAKDLLSELVELVRAELREVPDAA